MVRLPFLLDLLDIGVVGVAGSNGVGGVVVLIVSTFGGGGATTLLSSGRLTMDALGLSALASSEVVPTVSALDLFDDLLPLEDVDESLSSDMTDSVDARIGVASLDALGVIAAAAEEGDGFIGSSSLFSEALRAMDLPRVNAEKDSCDAILLLKLIGSLSLADPVDSGTVVVVVLLLLLLLLLVGKPMKEACRRFLAWKLFAWGDVGVLAGRSLSSSARSRCRSSSDSLSTSRPSSVSSASLSSSSLATSTF